MSFIKYLQETHAELKFVKWPSQKQTIVYTALVIVISIATAFYLGLFDFMFSDVLRRVTESTGSYTAPAAQVQDIVISTSTNATTSIATTTHN